MSLSLRFELARPAAFAELETRLARARALPAPPPAPHFDGTVRGGTSAAESVPLQPDGKIVLGGFARASFGSYALARIIP